MSFLCIYHNNCPDGFTAAWVVRKAMRNENIIFYGGVHNDPPPDVTGKNVILVDFSYSRPVMEQIIAKAASVTILDHHKTAQSDLDGLNEAFVIFDMKRSGARIAWDYYFPDKTPPQVLLHIEDYDLRRFALPKTCEIQASIFSYPYDFAVWDLLMTADTDDLAEEGEHIERRHLKDAIELISVVTRPMRIGGFLVDVANLPYTMTNQAALALAKGRPFGGCYWDTPQGRVFSLRSTENGEDVSMIAQIYGGGGHHHAAGFRVSFKQANDFEVC